MVRPSLVNEYQANERAAKGYVYRGLITKELDAAGEATKYCIVAIDSD